MADIGINIPEQDSQTTKKDKSPAMSVYEKSVFLDIVSKFKEVVESKQTDFGTTGKKNEAWKEIELEFCALEGTCKRDAGQLKNAWKNLKQKSKKEVSKQKKSIKKTGGGPPDAPLSEEAAKICNIIPTQMKSLENPYDCDGVEESDAVAAEMRRIDEQERFDHFEDSPPLKRSKPASDPQRKQKDARSSLVDMEYEEHKLRLRTLAIEQETAQILREKATMEKKFLEDEFSLRMKMLNAQANAFMHPYQMPKPSEHPFQDSGHFSNNDHYASGY